MSACFFFKQKTAYELRISDRSSDVCSSDLPHDAPARRAGRPDAARDLLRLVCTSVRAGVGTSFEHGMWLSRASRTEDPLSIDEVEAGVRTALSRRAAGATTLSST